jgi:hypothetical protein
MMSSQYRREVADIIASIMKTPDFRRRHGRIADVDLGALTS